MSCWRPLLDGPLRQDAIAAAQWAAERLVEAPIDQVTEPGVAEGLSGLALCLHGLSQQLGGPSRELVQPALDRAGDLVDGGDQRPGLHDGLAGIGVTLIQLQGPAAGDVCAQIDEALLSLLEEDEEWSSVHELRSGLAGIAVYALERWPSPSALQLSSRILDRLEAISERDPAGLRWRTPERFIPVQDRPRGPLYELGLAHGAPALLPFLARASKVPALRAKAAGLFDGAFRWIVAQARPADRGTRFVRGVYDSGPSEVERFAWCIGDPGVVAALVCSAREAQAPELLDVAVGLAEDAARWALVAPFQPETNLCCGTASVLQCFNRLYQWTGSEQCRHAAQRFAGHTARALLDTSVIAPPNPGWLTTFSFQWGIGGSALALLAAATETAPHWDRLLAISLRD